MNKKKFLALPLMLTIVIVIAAFTSMAAAASPIRIARLPILLEPNIMKPDITTMNTLEMQMARALFMPRNNILKKFEQLPKSELRKEFIKIWNNMNGTGNIAEKTALKTLAEKVNADVVVMTVICQYSQNKMPLTNINSVSGHLKSNVAIVMIIYDKRTDQFTKKTCALKYDNSYSPYGTVDVLARNCLLQLIDKIELRKRVLNAYEIK